MNLANYISDLLYRYDCVIIPDFGGFVTNRIGAKLDKSNHTFYPPSKKITFNNHLNINDGLLANYIASVENISYEKASNAIDLAVIKWQNELQTKTVTIGNIGFIKLNDAKKMVFEPNTSVNYLTSSFGLEKVATSAIDQSTQKVIPLREEQTSEAKKGVPAFIKYAATATILLTLGFAGFNFHQQQKQLEVVASQEKALTQKIQEATFVISNPLPTLELKVAKEEAKPFHVVAGAFEFPENAEKKVKQLKQKGYQAAIIGVNKWGLTEVAFESFKTRREATNALYQIQKTVSKDAWLLVKK